MKNNKVKNKASAFYIVLFVFLILYVVSFVFLFSWGFITTFKGANTSDGTGYEFNKVGLPNPWVFTNYIDSFNKLFVEINNQRFYVETMYLYAILYAVGCAFFATLVPCITAYVISKYKFFFSKIVYAFIIVTMSLHIVGATPSAIEMARAFGLYNSIWGLWVMSATMMAGIYFLVFYDTFKGIPQSYSEAAEIDGASNFRVMVSVMLPLAKNVFFTIFLIKLIAFWNDYQTPILYMPDKPTIAYGLFIFMYQSDSIYSSVPMKVTSAFLVAIPVALVFIIFQKRIMGNLTMGGIKG